MKMATPDFSGQSHEVRDAITELFKSHARHLIATALEVEVTSVINELKGTDRDVVRDGYLPERNVVTAVGDVDVEVPRIRARDGLSITRSVLILSARGSSSIALTADEVHGAR